MHDACMSREAFLEALALVGVIVGVVLWLIMAAATSPITSK